MMVPIVLGIVESVTDVAKFEDGADGDSTVSNFQIAMLLGVAYAASLGGVGTLVGTPPNAIVVGAGYVRREQMLRAGVLLDAVVILLTTGVAYLLIRLVWLPLLG